MSEYILNNNDPARTYLITKPKSQIIDRFTDFLSFLNNDEPSWVYNENMLFPSVSVAFQAARAQDLPTKEKIQQVDSPDELIEIALTIEDPPDWENKRLKVMEILIRDKFIRSLELRERLRLTEDKYEEETGSNLFWGYVGTKGQNWIGRLLEAVRKDIAEKSDMKKWLLVKFPLENDGILLPTIQLNVFKDGQTIETINLRGRNHYYMGQYKTNSVLLAHPSISRLHACIICEDNQKVRLIDLESKSGSFVNGEIIEKLQDREIKTGDILTFALSTRQYEVIVDYRQVDVELQKRFTARQQQVRQLQKLNQPNISAEELKQIMGFSIDDTLFVSGLPESASQLAVKALFDEIAKVKSVKIPIDKKTGRQRGFAYVVFETPEEFRKAHLKSMNLKFGERKLNVKIADKEKSQTLMEICKIEQEKKEYKKDFRQPDRSNRDERDFRRKRSESREEKRRERREDRDDNKKNSRERDNGRKRSEDRDQKRKRSYDRDSRRKRSEDREPRRKRSEDRDQKRKRSEDREPRRKRSEDREPRRKRSEDREQRRKRSEDREPQRKRSEDREPRRKRSEDREPRRKQDQGRSRDGDRQQQRKVSPKQEKQTDKNQDRERSRDRNKNSNKQEEKIISKDTKSNQRRDSDSSPSSSRSASSGSPSPSPSPSRSSSASSSLSPSK